MAVNSPSSMWVLTLESAVTWVWASPNFLTRFLVSITVFIKLILKSALQCLTGHDSGSENSGVNRRGDGE